MENTSVFSGKAEAYSAARPGYAGELMEWLTGKLGLGDGVTVADVGSGTGKFSKQLLETGCTVFGVEPNADMRAFAEKFLGNEKRFFSVNGSASDTALDSACVDHVTAASAFHWFDAAAFARECQRIVRPGGSAALVWNIRDASDQTVWECEELCRRLCPRFKGFSGNIHRDEGRVTGFFEKGCECADFRYDLFFSREAFVKRMLSSSYAPLPGEENFSAFAGALEELFDRRAEYGQIRIANFSRGYVGRV